MRFVSSSTTISPWCWVPDCLLESEGDIEVVGQAHNGLEALKMVRQHQPDSLLTDIEMPEISSLELASN